MGDQVLLIVAEDGDELVAGALNLIGGDTLFGRLWGCQPQTFYPFLHFEACYYQVRASHYLYPQYCWINIFIFSRFWFYGW
jgi:predicted N-acyltransferase